LPQDAGRKGKKGNEHEKKDAQFHEPVVVVPDAGKDPAMRAPKKPDDQKSNHVRKHLGPEIDDVMMQADARVVIGHLRHGHTDDQQCHGECEYAVAQADQPVELPCSLLFLFSGYAEIVRRRLQFVPIDHDACPLGSVRSTCRSVGQRVEKRRQEAPPTHAQLK
jgi:hypothetical protein